MEETSGRAIEKDRRAIDVHKEVHTKYERYKEYECLVESPLHT